MSAALQPDYDDDLPSRTPAEDGAAAYASTAGEWLSYWRGEGTRPVPRCYWSSRDDVDVWLEAFDAEVAKARKDWMGGLSRDEWVRFIGAEGG